MSLVIIARGIERQNTSCMYARLQLPKTGYGNFTFGKSRSRRRSRPMASSFTSVRPGKFVTTRRECPPSRFMYRSPALPPSAPGESFMRAMKHPSSKSQSMFCSPSASDSPIAPVASVTAIGPSRIGRSFVSFARLTMSAKRLSDEMRFRSESDEITSASLNPRSTARSSWSSASARFSRQASEHAKL